MQWGGEIGCESVLGKGSNFWFTAKLVTSNKKNKPVTDLVFSSMEHDLALLKGKRILVAEDNVFNQQVTTEILEHIGAIVAIAENGIKTLKMLKTQDFDCVLMDVQMPVMDGYETTKLIRQQSQWKNLPIIAITANAFN